MKKSPLQNFKFWLFSQSRSTIRHFICRWWCNSSYPRFRITELEYQDVQKYCISLPFAVTEPAQVICYEMIVLAARAFHDDHSTAVRLLAYRLGRPSFANPTREHEMVFRANMANFTEKPSVSLENVARDNCRAKSIKRIFPDHCWGGNPYKMTTRCGK